MNLYINRKVTQNRTDIKEWRDIVQKNALKSASTYYLIGTLFNKGFAFLTVPIFTRILSTADYGVVTTYDSWIGISSVVIGFAIYMGIRSSFVDYPER